MWLFSVQCFWSGTGSGLLWAARGPYFAHEGHGGKNGMFSMTETLDAGFDALVSRNERLMNCAVLSGLESRSSSCSCWMEEELETIEWLER